MRKQDDRVVYMLYALKGINNIYPHTDQHAILFERYKPKEEQTHLHT